MQLLQKRHHAGLSFVLKKLPESDGARLISALLIYKALRADGQRRRPHLSDVAAIRLRRTDPASGVESVSRNTESGADMLSSKMQDVSIHSRPIRRLTPQPTDRGRAGCPSLQGGVTEKDFIGFAVLSTPFFPLKGEVSNHKGIFDEHIKTFFLFKNFS